MPEEISEHVCGIESKPREKNFSRRGESGNSKFFSAKKSDGLWPLKILAVIGLSLSAYLSWHFLTGRALIGCGVTNSCDEILNSRWSSVGGILPVSGLAAGIYLAVFAASFSLGAATPFPVRRLAWRAMLVMAGVVAGSAVWFIIVQKFFIKSFCPYCMAAHVNGLLLAVFVVWRAQQQVGDNSRRLISFFPVTGLTFAGLALAATLAVCQASIAPRAVFRGGESREILPAIDTHDAPLVGSPDAPVVVHLLFDYKCPHCQQLHFLLDEAIRRYDGKLAFVLCPTPLNTQCNPYIPRDVNEFNGSCELAKIALAVWRAKRDAFPIFDQWMFSLDSGDRWHPRSLDVAKAKAVELVGQPKFDAALADAWVAQYLQTCIQIYGKTMHGGNNAVPKLVFGTRWVIPEPNDAGELVSILQNSLAVPKP